MAKAKKLPSGNWRVRAKCNGVTKSFTADNKRDAERLAGRGCLIGAIFYFNIMHPKLINAIVPIFVRLGR